MFSCQYADVRRGKIEDVGVAKQLFAYNPRGTGAFFSASSAQHRRAYPLIHKTSFLQEEDLSFRSTQHELGPPPPVHPYRCL